MKFCTACGAEYGDEILFCQRDGTPLRAQETARDLVGQIKGAKTWYQRAYSLNPRSVWQQILDGIN